MNKSERRSTLEQYIAMLRASKVAGVCGITHLQRIVNMNADVMKRSIAFLQKGGLLEIIIVKQRKHYKITEKGTHMLDVFDKLMVALPIEDKAHMNLKRYLEEVKRMKANYDGGS